MRRIPNDVILAFIEQMEEPVRSHLREFIARMFLGEDPQGHAATRTAAIVRPLDSSQMKDRAHVCVSLIDIFIATHKKGSSASPAYPMSESLLQSLDVAWERLRTTALSNEALNSARYEMDA